MTAQVNLLQSELERALMAPVAPVAAPVDQPTPSAPAPGAAQADPDYLDKALAKALAAARTEADQRARLERELTQLKAVAQSHTRHAADEGHNRRMFTLMNKQTTAALDEIARLSGAAGQVAEAAPGQ